jgi:shikimate kinase
MNLFLIGYRCSGKTTVGKSIADAIDWAFVDADAMLVEACGKSIIDIIATDGWEAFRSMERSTLKQICAADRQVVATGGGVVLDAANIETMKTNGRVIWLVATAATIRKRMRADENTTEFRPALTDKGTLAEIEDLLAERNPYYERASDVIIHTDSLPVAEIAHQILHKLNQAVSQIGVQDP